MSTTRTRSDRAGQSGQSSARHRGATSRSRNRPAEDVDGCSARRGAGPPAPRALHRLSSKSTTRPSMRRRTSNSDACGSSRCDAGRRKWSSPKGSDDPLLTTSPARSPTSSKGRGGRREVE